jgi:hypothetical protein
MASRVVSRQLCVAYVSASIPEASTQCRQRQCDRPKAATSSSFVSGRAFQINPACLPKGQRVACRESKVMRVASSHETNNRDSAEDDTQSLRPKISALRLTAENDTQSSRLKAQRANSSLSKYQDEHKEEVYGMETYDHNQQTSVANRTMITVRFQVHYQTNFGQELLVGGSHPALGAWDTLAAIPMVWTSGDIWTCEVNSHLYFFENVFSLSISRQASAITQL